MTSIKNKYYRVVENRSKEYMKYKDFCRLLPIVKKSIMVTMDAKNMRVDFIPFKKTLKIWGEWEQFKSIVDFTKTMLAMKALRSLTAQKKTYNDCIIDFVNYKRLSIEALESTIVAFNYPSFNIVFSESMFNTELNNKKINIDNVKFLINDKCKKSLLSMYKIKAE